MKYLATGATISENEIYRYWLWREWISHGPKKTACFVGLNPSVADDKLDDPTIRRCVAFANDWGCNRLLMVNLFALRATDPMMMLSFRGDPIGPENDRWIKEAALGSDIVVAAWGTNGSYMDRGAAVREILRAKLSYLKLTKDGHPNHPLYLPAGLQPIAWE